MTLTELQQSHARSPEAEQQLSQSKQRSVFVLLCAQIFITQLGFALFAPFFPDEAAEKNISTKVAGWIFGVFQGIIVVFTPVAAKLLKLLGPTTLLNCSNCVSAAANIAFAFVWYVDAGARFGVACIVLRVVLGICVAIGAVVAFGQLPVLFDDNLSTGSSTLEATYGVSDVFSPVLGAAMYKLGGSFGHNVYVWPFLFLGILQAMFAVCFLYWFPKLPVPRIQNTRLTQFAPLVVFPCIAELLASAALEWTGPTMEAYLGESPFDMGVGGVGALYAVLSCVYAAAGVSIGKVDDKFEGRHSNLIMSLGIVVLGLAFMILGPVPWVTTIFFWERSRVNLWISTLLIALGSALSIIPAYGSMYMLARHEHEDDRANAAAALSTSMFALGAALGPIVAGWLGDSHVLGIAGSYAAFGAALLTVGVLALVLTLLRVRPFIRAPSSTITNSSSMSLVDVAATESADRISVGS